MNRAPSTASKFKTVTHVIFDMDGVLLDTESLYTLATNNIVKKYGKTYDWSIKSQVMGNTGAEVAKKIVQLLELPLTWEEYYKLAKAEYELIMRDCKLMPAQSFGKIYTPEIQCKVVGTPEKDSIRIAIKEMNLPISHEHFQFQFRSMTRKLTKNAPLIQGAQKLVTHLHKKKIPIAVATSSCQESFELKTEKHKDFFKLFSHIVCGGTDPEVKHGKPAPDIFLDTEHLYMQANHNVLKQYGKNYNWELRSKYMGLTGAEHAKKLTEILNLPISWEEYLTLARAEYQTVMKDVELLPGAERLVKHLHKQNIPICVGTSSSKESWELKTKNHREFFKLFHHIVCGGSDPDVKHGKPEPDIFVVCANRFSEKPNCENCLVFEDAPNGVKAAKTAGMQTVMLPNKNLSEDQTKNATLVTDSLENIDLTLFGLPALKKQI